jgi:tetratricopeptide (TPR) repeat protein
MFVPALLFALVSAGQPVPPVPALALDRFPPAARDMLSRAHQHAMDHSRDAEAVGALGRALQAWEQWESAHQAYARAQELAPRAFEWHYLDAIVLQRQARHDEAVPHFRAALSARPDYLPARLKLAEALFETGAFAESRSRLEALVPEPAAEAAAQVTLGRIDAAEGRHAGAIAHFERAVVLYPQLGAAHYGLARSAHALGRTADAERAMTQHSRYGALWPRLDDPVAAAVASLRDDGRAVLARGIASADAGDLEAAIAAHEEALRRDASLVGIHANLLSLYGRAKNWAKADEHYRAALASGFAPADLHYDYGVIMGEQQRFDAAEEAYRRAVAANPLHARAHNNLGQLLERRRDFEGAASEYRLATTAQPGIRIARFNLGRMLLAMAQPGRASAEFEQLREPVDQETPAYLFALSTAYVRGGRRNDGIKVALEAQQLARDFGQKELADAIARELSKLK